MTRTWKKLAFPMALSAALVGCGETTVDEPAANSSAGDVDPMPPIDERVGPADDNPQRYETAKPTSDAATSTEQPSDHSGDERLESEDDLDLGQENDDDVDVVEEVDAANEVE